MINFSNYPLEDRCLWWCEMNAMKTPSDFPFDTPPVRSIEADEIFISLTKATPERDRLAAWRKIYSKKS